MDECNNFARETRVWRGLRALAFFFVARKCHLQSTGLENKVSENRRWDGDPPRGFNGYAGRLPSLSHRSKHSRWLLPLTQLYRHGYV
jgi:hypothetical protein